MALWLDIFQLKQTGRAVLSIENLFGNLFENLIEIFYWKSF